VAVAVDRRARLFGPFGAEPRTSAYRLVHGEGDGVPGLAVDTYAGFLVIQIQHPAKLRPAAQLEATLQAHLRPRGVVWKRRYDETARGKVREEVRAGEKPPERLIVREEGVPFEAQLIGSAHTGLFTDMRPERLRLRRMAKDRRVLNAFAYTGTFSIAAALGGARQVVSVDLASGALERARRNFRLSGLDPAAHHFAAMEVREYLRMARRRGWSFDAIVLDPPAAARYKSGHWALKSDYPELLGLALSVLERRGLLWVAANMQGIDSVGIDRIVSSALRAAGRSARVLARAGLPPDYPTLPSSPRSRYLKIRVLEVG
jgi:23S rRNA (cytosine1962-C5)-methyltransferase